MNTLLLLLLDSRAPAGAHHHSGGMEAAIGTGLVTGLAGLEDFCQARLRTSARVTAAFAAAACGFSRSAPNEPWRLHRINGGCAPNEPWPRPQINGGCWTPSSRRARRPRRCAPRPVSWAGRWYACSVRYFLRRIR